MCDRHKLYLKGQEEAKEEKYHSCKTCFFCLFFCSEAITVLTTEDARLLERRVLMLIWEFFN